MTTAGSYTETFVEVADVRLQLRQGGTGEPLLVLHGELGVPGWLQAYALLAEHYTVYVPSLPGFGQSARPDWILSVRDLAAWVSWFVRDLQLPQPLNVIGCSAGGWIAAEIATVNAALFQKMVLVGAAGLKPEVGEVWDYFVHAPKEAFTQAFYDPESVHRVYPVLWKTLDARGRAAGGEQSGDGQPSALEAVHAQPHACRLAARDRHADVTGLGTRGRDHAAQRLHSSISRRSQAPPCRSSTGAATCRRWKSPTSLYR